MKIPKQPPLAGEPGISLRIAEIPYETGELHFRISQKNSANGTNWLPEGPFEEYYQNGIPAAKGFYLNGQKNGHWKRYHANGKPASDGYYRNDQENGHWKTYYENGKLSAEGTYFNGVQNGHWKTYYENGILAAEGDYNNGEKTGTWQHYSEDGSSTTILPLCTKNEGESL